MSKAALVQEGCFRNISDVLESCTPNLRGRFRQQRGSDFCRYPTQPWSAMWTFCPMWEIVFQPVVWDYVPTVEPARAHRMSIPIAAPTAVPTAMHSTSVPLRNGTPMARPNPMG